MFSSAKRACEIFPPVPRIPTQPIIEMGTVWTSMLEWNQRCSKRYKVSAMWEERADQICMEVCPNITCECCNRDAVETLSWYATVGGIRTEQQYEMFRRRHEYDKSSMETVISTTTSHKAKKDWTQSGVVTHKYADAMRVPGHYASTLRTQALKSVVSRMLSKCRTRQLESCDTLSAFFHAWLEGEASERSWTERWLVLAAGKSAPSSSESRSVHPVVARRRPHGDRREVRGESGRSL